MSTLRGIYAIIDPSVVTDLSPENLALDYLRGGISILQLRDKRRSESTLARRRFRETALKIAALKKEFSFLFIVNDDIEVAKEVGADGVHVGVDDAALEVCRTVLGKEKIIGYSSHSLEEALEAEKRGADYVAFGAIYPSPTKGPGHPVQGVNRLKEVVSCLKVPVVAIGGIGRNNIKEVLSTGVSMVAMISALAKARDRVQESRLFCSLIRP